MLNDILFMPLSKYEQIHVSFVVQYLMHQVHKAEILYEWMDMFIK